MLQQLHNPLGILNIRLASGDKLDMLGIDSVGVYTSGCISEQVIARFEQGTRDFNHNGVLLRCLKFCPLGAGELPIGITKHD